MGLDKRKEGRKMNKDIEFLKEFKLEILQSMELLKLLKEEKDENEKTITRKYD